MLIGEFRDEVRKLLGATNRLQFECVTSNEPDELDLEIHDVETDWRYMFSGTSWISLLAALQAAIANGDLDDPKDKYPEYN